MSLVRILKTASVLLSHTFYVDEVPTDASGSVTATLKRLDGTTVNSATAGHPGPPGVYTYTVPSQANLDSLTLDWSGTFGGAAVTVRDYVEIVGGHLFTLADARSQLGLSSTYSTDLLADKRIEVEQEFEGICRQAFVPRFSREIFSGRDQVRLMLAWGLVRSVRAVSIGGVALSGSDVAAIGFADHGVLTRPGDTPWPKGLRNIIVEYEHGRDLPPDDVRTAGMLRLRSRISMPTTAIPDRAVSYTVAEGGVYRLSTPSRQKTGLPEVDGVLERYPGVRQRAVFA